jgi:hypothetical protein
LCSKRSDRRQQVVLRAPVDLSFNWPGKISSSSARDFHFPVFSSTTAGPSIACVFHLKASSLPWLKSAHWFRWVRSPAQRSSKVLPSPRLAHRCSWAPFFFVSFFGRRQVTAISLVLCPGVVRSLFCPAYSSVLQTTEHGARLCVWFGLRPWFSASIFLFCSVSRSMLPWLVCLCRLPVSLLSHRIKRLEDS